MVQSIKPPSLLTNNAGGVRRRGERRVGACLLGQARRVLGLFSPVPGSGMNACAWIRHPGRLGQRRVPGRPAGRPRPRLAGRTSGPRSPGNRAPRRSAPRRVPGRCHARARRQPDPRPARRGSGASADLPALLPDHLGECARVPRCHRPCRPEHRSRQRRFPGPSRQPAPRPALARCRRMPVPAALQRRGRERHRPLGTRTGARREPRRLGAAPPRAPPERHGMGWIWSTAVMGVVEASPRPFTT